MQDDDAYARARRLYLAAALGTVGGLAVAGSVDANAGGVIVVASWALGVWALHRLGRTGSTRA